MFKSISVGERRETRDEWGREIVDECPFNYFGRNVYMECSTRVMLALLVGVLLVIASSLYVSREYLTNSKYCLGDTCVDETELGQMKTLVENPSEVWGTNSKGVIYKRPGDGSGSWQKIGGELKDVSVGSRYVWGVNKDDQIYKCKRPCTGGWEQVSGGLAQIDIG